VSSFAVAKHKHSNDDDVDDVGGGGGGLTISFHVNYVLMMQKTTHIRRSRHFSRVVARTAVSI